jgi:poly-gamma-glutamate synthesis protein (capsule biosynthesis protein)
VPATGEQVSIVFTGDVLLHERLWATARLDGRGRLDFAAMLAPVRPLVADADLAICHLETPLAPPGGPFRGYPRFSVPPQIATALKQTGYDACTTASNHSFDAGAAGVDRTLGTLDAAGLSHAGTARTAAEAAKPTLLDAHGVKVAVLSYAFGFNGLPYPGGQVWRANLLDETRIHAEAARARAAGADIVVLACQWGDEYVHEPSRQQRLLAPRFVADSNIDLVVGHHAHVVQPVERIGGKWVAYGLGNLVAAHREPWSASSEGLLTRFTFTRAASGRWSASGAEYAALLVTDTLPVRVVDVRRQFAATPTQRLRLAQRRTDEIVAGTGSGATPITR